MPAPDSSPTPSKSSDSRYVAELPFAEDLQEILPKGQYLISTLLGQDGSSAVYSGFRMPESRPVAIKVMRRSTLGSDFAFEDRFRRETRAIAAISHPHIVKVYECGDAGPDFQFVSMELVDGGDLRRLLDAGTLTPERTLALVVQICDALQVAHEQGIVHRDIKPTNILITREGDVKVADFGVAKTVDASSFMTRGGAGMGTQDFAAPEQFGNAASMDHRADIYSVGVLLYRMLTGVLPRGAYHPPSKRADVDPRLDAIVFRCMEHDRNDRYQSAAELKDDILALADPNARPASTANMVASVQLSKSAAPVRTPIRAAKEEPVAKAAPAAPVAKPAPPKSARNSNSDMASLLVMFIIMVAVAVGAWLMLKPKPNAPTENQGAAPVSAPAPVPAKAGS